MALPHTTESGRGTKKGDDVHRARQRRSIKLSDEETQINLLKKKTNKNLLFFCQNNFEIKEKK